MTGPNETTEHDAAAEAADWFVRLRSDVVVERDWLEFQTWLAADPLNEPAFRDVEALWLDLEGAAVEEEPGTIVPFRQKSPSRIPGFLPWAGLAAATLAVGVFLLGRVPHSPPDAASEQTIEVASGQSRTIPLADGSVVVGSGTSMTLSTDARGPHAHILTGSATFHMKHDPARRLTVLAAGQQIVDVGTIFTTVVRDSSLVVSVTEGEVAVQQAQGQGSALHVRAGQALIRGSADPTSRITAQDFSPLRRPYQNARLTQVAADLSRFYSRPIAIDGKSVGELRFTGVLVLDSEEAVVRRLETYLPIKARYAPDVITLASH